jgi:hypothetical protein
MALIGLLGSIGSGKGTVSDILVDNHHFVKDSFASSLKDGCAQIFDWPRDLLEGDTKESREWREQCDEWWAEKLGIEGFSPRLCLQLVGTESLRNNFHSDIWLLTLENRLRKNPDQNVVIADVRFPNEIEMVSRVGGKLILVERGDKPEWWDIAIAANNGDSAALHCMKTDFHYIHASEWAWVGANVDHIIDNNGTIDELREKVLNIIS